MGPLVLTDLGLQTLVVNSVQPSSGAVKGVFNGAYIALITANFAATQNRVLADLTEAAFTDYARQAITWGAAKKMASGSWGAIATTVLVWSIGSTDPPTLIYGYALVTASTAGSLLASALFDTPFALATSAAEVALVPEVSFPPATDWGEAALLG